MLVSHERHSPKQPSRRLPVSCLRHLLNRTMDSVAREKRWLSSGAWFNLDICRHINCRYTNTEHATDTTRVPSFPHPSRMPSNKKTFSYFGQKGHETPQHRGISDYTHHQLSEASRVDADGTSHRSYPYLQYGFFTMNKDSRRLRKAAAVEIVPMIPLKTKYEELRVYEPIISECESLWDALRNQVSPRPSLSCSMSNRSWITHRSRPSSSPAESSAERCRTPTTTR